MWGAVLVSRDLPWTMDETRDYLSDKTVQRWWHATFTSHELACRWAAGKKNYNSFRVHIVKVK